MATITYQGRKQSFDFQFDDHLLGRLADIKKRVIKGKTGCYLYLVEDGLLIPASNWVLGVPRGVLVDHINRNTTDNRKENLRTCTRSQNGLNRVVRGNETPGVFFDKGRNMWCARLSITKNGATVTQKFRFKDKADAVARRKIMEQNAGMRWSSHGMYLELVPA